MFPQFWNDWPLGRIFLSVTVLVLIFLGAVLALGVRQYLLYRQCNQAVVAADRLLFRFTAIKDHLDASLLLNEEVNLRTFSEELQELEAEAEKLSHHLLVPESLKAALPSRVDLVGLEVRLRAVQEQHRDKADEAAGLVRSLGNINLGLQQFRLQLGDHTQTILLGLHKIIAGSLGLIVALTCSLLYLLNRRLAAPMLNLCRIAAPADASEETIAQCSLRILTQRLQTLLVEGGSKPLEGESAAFADRERLLQAATGYRHAVTGWLGGELASELTNRLNGVINYTQALADLEGQERSAEFRQDLQRRLVEEERKTAELVGGLQQMGRWQSGRDVGVPMRTLSGLLALLLERSFRAESITFTLSADSHCEPLMPAGDLLLVLITLLHQGRMALNRTDFEKSDGKVLRLACSTPSSPIANRLLIDLSNSAGRWKDTGSASIWPSQRFCAALLQAHGGALHIETAARETVLRLELTCRSSVA